MTATLTDTCRHGHSDWIIGTDNIRRCRTCRRIADRTRPRRDRNRRSDNPDVPIPTTVVNLIRVAAETDLDVPVLHQPLPPNFHRNR